MSKQGFRRANESRRLNGQFRLRCEDCGFERWGDQHEQDKRWKVICTNCGGHFWNRLEEERKETVKILMGKRKTPSELRKPYDNS